MTPVIALLLTLAHFLGTLAVLGLFMVLVCGCTALLAHSPNRTGPDWLANWLPNWIPQKCEDCGGTLTDTHKCPARRYTPSWSRTGR